MTDEMKILRVLEGDDPPQRTHKIAEAAGVDRGTVEAKLRILRENGKAHSDARGNWFKGPGAVAA